jgi:hypothetical protein
MRSATLKQTSQQTVVVFIIQPLRFCVNGPVSLLEISDVVHFLVKIYAYGISEAESSAVFRQEAI